MLKIILVIELIKINENWSIKINKNKNCFDFMKIIFYFLKFFDLFLWF